MLWVIWERAGSHTTDDQEKTSHTETFCTASWVPNLFHVHITCTYASPLSTGHHSLLITSRSSSTSGAFTPLQTFAGCSEPRWAPCTKSTGITLSSPSLLLLPKRTRKIPVQFFSHKKPYHHPRKSSYSLNKACCPHSLCHTPLCKFLLFISHLPSGSALPFAHSWQGTIAHYRGIPAIYFHPLTFSSN